LKVLVNTQVGARKFKSAYVQLLLLKKTGRSCNTCQLCCCRTKRMLVPCWVPLLLWTQ